MLGDHRLGQPGVESLRPARRADEARLVPRDDGAEIHDVHPTLDTADVTCAAIA